VRHQRGAEPDQQRADGAVVAALAEDPHAAAVAVEVQRVRDVRGHRLWPKWSLCTGFIGLRRPGLQSFVALLLFSSIVAGCGGNGQGGATAPRTTTIGESGPGGAGDENAIATQVVYDVSGKRALPPSASAPAFLRIALTLRSADDRQHVVRLALRSPLTLTVPPGGARTQVIGGQRRGTYAISVDGAKPSARLVVG
jgi:hypothetical protein